MKQGLLSSYIAGIKEKEKGESFEKIFKYFLPEFITAIVLYSALYLLDARFIADLKSTSTYATLGSTNTLLHFLIKVAEGLSIGSIIIGGQYNGAQNYHGVGKTLRDTFWLTFILGFVIASSLYFGAYWIYKLYGVPDKMIDLGIPFLRLRAIGVFFTFIYFAFISFLRGIKNTKTPMYVFIIGAITFLFFDYSLIFGKFGFPELKLQGSAIASVIQYGIMLLIVSIVVLTDKEYKKYSVKLFTEMTDFHAIKRLLIISWPIVLDKATIAMAYIWLGSMFNPMGKVAIASFSVIKDMERVAFLPAIAFAQVITFLISNDLGAGNFEAIKTNIKKVVFLASIAVFIILSIFLAKTEYFISIFDQKGTFTAFAARAFPPLSILVFFDILQLILSGALRGMGDVKTVMMTRITLVFGAFIPITYFISKMTTIDGVMKFVLIYGMFYICSALMSVIYIKRFRKDFMHIVGKSSK